MTTTRPKEQDYKLPVCDVDEERRNFKGYDKYEDMYTLEDMQGGDAEGTTDTDIRTHTDYSSHMKGYSRRSNKAVGYTRINQTQGKGRKAK